MKIIILVVCLLSANLFAQGNLDAASQKALQQTIELLTNPQKRNQAAQENEKTKDAHGFASKVVGNDPAKMNELYGIVSQIMQSIVAKTNGDVSKMNEILEQAQKDPEAFYKSLTPAQQNQIKQLSRSLASPTSPNK